MDWRLLIGTTAALMGILSSQEWKDKTKTKTKTNQDTEEHQDEYNENELKYLDGQDAAIQEYPEYNENSCDEEENDNNIDESIEIFEQEVESNLDQELDKFNEINNNIDNTLDEIEERNNVSVDHGEEESGGTPVRAMKTRSGREVRRPSHYEPTFAKKSYNKAEVFVTVLKQVYSKYVFNHYSLCS